MAKKSGSGDYEVGFGKPPKHSQYKKGVSGNPSGKRSKAQSFSDKLKAIAEEEIVVRKNGQSVSMTNLDAALYAAFAKAQGGNPQFFRIIFQEMGLRLDAMPEPHALSVIEPDLAVLQTQANFLAIIERAQAEIAGSAPSYSDEEMDNDDTTKDF